MRMLQEGESLRMPWSRPMPDIGARCHELRIDDKGRTWRVIYRADPDAVVIAEVFEKKTPKHPSMSSMSVAVGSGTTTPFEEIVGHDY